MGRSAASANPEAEGEGSTELNPRGITGTITMKMMSMTSRTSISGVTLISEERLAPPEFPVVENAIALVSHAELGVRALHRYRHQETTKSSGRLANRPHRP